MEAIISTVNIIITALVFRLLASLYLRSQVTYCCEMADLNDMNLDTFRMWSVTALKTFLSLRKKTIEGAADELAARAFIAWEEKVPVDVNAEHEERKLLQEYKTKLLTEHEVLPDPFSLQSGWVGEKDGIAVWPSVYITDISSYLNDNTPQELVHKVVNEYKVGKAYRYYACDWVKEVMYHPVKKTQWTCVPKARVTPSMTINSYTYDVWVAVTKRSDTSAGGRIVSAYCTCTAGMLGTCNHIAGLLFRVETAVVTGKTAQTCTDTLCQWTIPKQKISMKAVTADSLSWTKQHFNTRGNDAATSVRAQLSKAKAQYSPLTSMQAEVVKDKRQIRNKLSAIAARCAPDARFHKLMNREPPVQQQSCPLTLLKMAADCVHENGDTPETRHQFQKDLHFSPEQSAQLKTATTQQGNKEWQQQRKGRITASNFGRVNTRMQTLDYDETADPTSLLVHVLGYKDSFENDSTRHGISCEPHAKLSYTRQMKKHHQKFKSDDSGISVIPEKPYISASADLEVECECCGKGVCEIKCPSSIKDQKPAVDNVPYLELVDGEVKLKSKDKYYAQVQGQMGILNRKYCDFYVFTFHGSLCVRVLFDERMWNEMLDRLNRFWMCYVLPELFSQDCKRALDIQKSTKIPCSAASASTKFTSATCDGLPSIKRKPAKRTSKSVKRRRVEKKAVYLCSVCGLVCIEDPLSADDESIECSQCSMWCHLPCGNVDSDNMPADEDAWFCPKCVN